MEIMDTDRLVPQHFDCGAELSPDGIYRYTLTRGWDEGPCVAWLMFNPSTADASIDDQTIRKCIGFSKYFGYGRMIVVNLYAVRSRDPGFVAYMGQSAIGPLNDYWIWKSVDEASEVICAWGCAQHWADTERRAKEVLEFIHQAMWVNFRKPISCLGYRKDGHPKHPLMLPYTTQRVPFELSALNS